MEKSKSPGRMVASDFEFGKQIGTGAFSKVVIGVYKPTGVQYAVKLISKRTILNASSDEERTRMAEVAKRESRMLLMCEHSNIVKFYASMQTTEDLVYVTELCKGGELLGAIRDLGRIPLEATRFAMAELFSALFYLHSGAKKQVPPGSGGGGLKQNTIIHRDVKPENIMLSETKHVKLIDFGTAVICESVHDRPESEEGGKGRAQTFCGTTYYMSPELLQNSYTCCASDYWGCGCVMYLMLTGKRPFDAPTQYLLIKAILEQEPEYPSNMDPQAVDLVKKLLTRSPDSRIGMDGVKKHPFFSTVNFDNLPTESFSDLWKKETPWVDGTRVTECASCRKPFGWMTGKDFCRNCGQYFCSRCLSEKVLLSFSMYDTPQPVCAACRTALNTEPDDAS